MMPFKKHILISLLVVAVLGLVIIPASAHDAILSVNSGRGNAVWYVSGEPSLVMNGFDLTPTGLDLPLAIGQVNFSVEQPVPGTPIDLVIFQDANGGSPIDAELVRHEQVDITSAGTFTYVFESPVVVMQPVVWVGFYLPVDFKFLADTSGTSVLTYWGWQPGGGFDPTNLTTASVFGPADGSAPVEINMNGVARLTIGVETPSTEAVASAGGIRQYPGNPNVTLYPAMQSYDYCSPLLIDREDTSIEFGEGISFHCQVAYEGFAPENPTGYERRGFLFDIFSFGDQKPQAELLPAPVTHCIRPAPEDLETAMIGVAYGSPRFWRILPTQRYEDAVCAEVIHMGFISYFVPVSTEPAS